VIPDLVLRGLVLRGLRLAAWPLSTPSELSERSFEAALLDLLDHPDASTVAATDARCEADPSVRR
jgi:hypothetical protein